MALQNRNTLRNYFRKGQLPREGHFADLIESMVNKIDDGLSKSLEQGLELSPIGASPKLMSFFKSIEDKNPAWSINIDSGNAMLNIDNAAGDAILTFTQEGQIGVHNQTPEHELDVSGTVGMQGRIGTYKTGKIPGDGKWHTVLEELNGCQAFEITAGIGKKGRGQYALIHAHALSTFGKSNWKIQKVQAHYGARCNMIQLRWQGSTFDYRLEMRTRCAYGDNCHIKYHISKLWHDEFMDDTQPD
ncbi:MAG: adhesin [Bernardetiaceae bacterium]|nr:adhesin [Bernardetiaceae bacterium]